MDDIKPPTQPTTAPVMDVQPPQVPVEVENTTPVVVAAPEQTVDAAQPVTTEPEKAEPLVATPGPNSHHHKAPIGAIVVAVIVTGALAVVSVLAYGKYQQKPADTAATTQTTTEPTETVKASDVDDTTKALDDSLNEVNETTDYNTEDLSDTSLSL